MHRAVCFFVLLLLVYPTRTYAQTAVTGARAAALAGASTALLDDTRGSANPAAWGFVDTGSLILNGAQFYSLPELRFGDAVALVPIRAGSLAAGASTFGYELYRATSVELGFGVRIAQGTYREIGLGMRPRWHVVTIPGYGRAAAVSLTAGMILPLTPMITLGAAAHQLTARGQLARELPRRLAIGVAFRSSTQFAFTADVTRDVRRPTSLAGGVELALSPTVVFRTGVGSAPARLATGIGIVLPYVVADIAAERHDVLGWTPSVSLRMNW